MAKKARVTGGALRLREAPSISAGILLILQDEAEVTVKTPGKEWTLVEAEKTEGYVMSRYLGPIEEVPEEQEEQEPAAAVSTPKKKSAAPKKKSAAKKAGEK